MIKSQIRQTVMIRILAAIAMSASACLPPLGEACGDGWCSEKQICVDQLSQQPICIRSTCGNGITNPGKTCDDSNHLSGDSCSVNCAIERCGNGILGDIAGEECDDGNTTDGDGCSASCTIERCGNGILDRAHGEQCDDGNTTDGNGCSANCILEHCGNGTLDPFEQCDDGNRIDGDNCSINCTIEGCGNGILDRTQREQCDDNNTTDGDGCSATCILEHCGNSILDPFEQCDDGKHTNGDDCEADCTLPSCGNGIFDIGEQCDDDNHKNGDGCEADCTLPACGNHIHDLGEQCDDGNAIGGDGCSAACTFERCGSSIVDLGEQCDDGNTINGDDCEADCTLPACGNGIVDFGEQCDDGNAVDFDACKNNCTASPQASAYLKTSNTDADDRFGTSVALSADGSTLAVGALLESSAATGVGGSQADNSDLGAGAVYVYTRSGTTWIQQAYLKASNTDVNDLFGRRIALSADGSTLAVAAVGEDSAAIGVGGNQADNSAGSSGAAYVFTRSGTTWSQQAYLKASNTDINDEFGWSVALSADGSTLAVGAEGESSTATGSDGNQANNSASSAGAVYVYIRNGTTWSQQAYLKASNTDANDRFGSSVALSADGSTLAVSAPEEASAAISVGGNQTDNSAPFAGAAYVFTRSGPTWSQQAYLKASNTDARDEFGSSVALSADGSTLAVSAAFEASAATGVGGNQADNSALSAGAAYVFTRSGPTWSQQAYLKASNTDANDVFGASVVLSADGSTLAVSAPREASAATGVGGNQADNSADSAGAAYVYKRSGPTWSQQAYLKASNTNRIDEFGSSVALSASGSILVVGAVAEDSAAIGVGGNQADNSANNAGAIYVFY